MRIPAVASEKTPSESQTTSSPSSPKSPADAARRGGHVAIDVPSGYEVCQALAAREIVVDYRPDTGLRVAPHFYNTADEVRACVQAVRDILDSGEHEAFAQQERRPG